jgi:hypothetical protein
LKEFLCLQHDSLIVVLCTSAQHATLQKYFSHPSLVIYFFSNPTHKTKIGTATRWETTNSKPHGPIIMIGQSETMSSSQIISITVFAGRCTALLCHLLASANCTKFVGQNDFAEPNQHVLTFLHPILVCRVTYWAPLGMLQLCFTIVMFCVVHWGRDLCNKWYPRIDRCTNMDCGSFGWNYKFCSQVPSSSPPADPYFRLLSWSHHH